MKLKYRIMATTFLAGTCVYLLGETLSLEPSTAKASMIIESTNPIPQNPLAENIISPLGFDHFVTLSPSPKPGDRTVSGLIGMSGGSVLGTTVTVTVGNNTVLSTTAGSAGDFQGTLSGAYAFQQGDIVTVTANFKDGNVSIYRETVSGAFRVPTITTKVREGVTVLTGTAEPDSYIDIVDSANSSNNLVGKQTRTSKAGIWSAELLAPLREGESIHVNSSSTKGDSSSLRWVLIGAAMNPVITSDPENGSTTVSGMSAGGANVELWNDGVRVGTATADKFGDWNVTVQPLIGGDTLVVKATLFGKMKESTPQAVSLSKLEQVSSVTTNSTKVKGKGVVGATVSVKESNNEIGTGVVDGNGDFEITILKQTEGSTLSITQTRKGTTSEATEIIVAKGLDKVSDISEVTMDSTSLTGKGSPGATISVKAKGVEIGTARVTSTGDCTVNIAKQEEGTELSITQAKDGDESETTKITVGLSKLEQVSPVTTNSTKVKGKGAVGATVSVRESNNEIGTGVVDGNGDFEITIPKQTEGSTLSITQSRNGTISEATEITVTKGLDKVSDISEVTTESTSLTGKGTPEATISVKVKGVEIGTARVTSTGDFTINIAKQEEGTELSITQTKDGDESETTKITVGLSKLEQVSPVTTNSTKVKGKGAVGATVSVKESNNEIGTGIVDGNGDVEITIPKQTEGSTLSITQIRKGITSEATEITVTKGLDKVSNISEVTMESTSLTGKGSSGATISVKVKGVEVGTATVTSTGDFTVNIAKQEEGTELFITQAKDGDESEATKIIVEGVQLNAPTISTHYLGATYLTVKAPDRAEKVMLRIGGRIIRTINVTAPNQAIRFYVNDLPALKIPGATFEFVAQDSKGRDGEVATGTVKEVPEPTLATYKLGEVNITGRVGTDITRISLYNKAGVLLRNGQIEADGTFKILATNLPALQIVGDTFSVRASTASGAISGAIEGIIHPGVLSAAPTIVDYYVTDSYMTGQVAPNAVKVLLRIDGRNIRIGTIAADGTFRIYTNDVNELKEVGAQFEVVTQDANHFYSEVAVGSTNFIEAPVVSTFRAGQSYINGTVAKGVTRVSVNDKSGTLLRYGQVYENGTFRIYAVGLDALQTAGETFSVQAYNANGNRSEETKVTIQP
ncbi:hypothetical protein HCB21_08150 [Listeria booriae]|uniref:Ig-like domain-containing protein n=1 Tax=Listeria booriae TaxID=1552123 RepID=UPI001628988F|nr:Ig-like domain-containing protein [Listeria booriae]MBC2159734.1 hypothetical protein [Listeria booriae]